jgi:Spy/CpxP family protein refolding chaperone
MMLKKHAWMALAASVVLSGAAFAQPYGGGPGMMGGYGPGAGMMGGYGSGYGGGNGMGPGMMGGYGLQAYADLKLSAEQQKKVTAIQQESSKAMWQLMGTMHEQGYHMHGMFGPGSFDEAAARKAFQTMQETQKAMFELQLEAHKKIDAVLTKEQREQLRR